MTPPPEHRGHAVELPPDVEMLMEALYGHDYTKWGAAALAGIREYLSKQARDILPEQCKEPQGDDLDAALEELR